MMLLNVGCNNGTVRIMLLYFGCNNGVSLNVRNFNDRAGNIGHN